MDSAKVKQNRNPYIMVLIDGDGMIVRPLTSPLLSHIQPQFLFSPGIN